MEILTPEILGFLLLNLKYKKFTKSEYSSFPSIYCEIRVLESFKSKKIRNVCRDEFVFIFVGFPHHLKKLNLLIFFFKMCKFTKLERLCFYTEFVSLKTQKFRYFFPEKFMKSECEFSLRNVFKGSVSVFIEK